MNRRKIIVATMLLLGICNLLFAQPGPQFEGGKLIAPTFPNPKLAFVGKEAYTANGQHFIRYNLRVLNFSAYPDALFAAAPALPPCGANASAARTWVDIFDASTNQRIYGFCALGDSQDLTHLWFAVKVGEAPPNCVYIVMTDRKFNKKYISNKVCFPPAGVLKPDLTIKGFAFGVDKKSIKVHVENNGQAFSAPCILRLTVRKINGTPVGRTMEVHIPLVPKGGDFTTAFSAKQLLPNDVALAATTFRLNVDATTIVAESNETNNEVWHNLN